MIDNRRVVWNKILPASYSQWLVIATTQYTPDSSSRFTSIDWVYIWRGLSIASSSDSSSSCSMIYNRSACIIYTTNRLGFAASRLTSSICQITNRTKLFDTTRLLVGLILIVNRRPYICRSDWLQSLIQIVNRGRRFIYKKKSRLTSALLFPPLPLLSPRFRPDTARPLRRSPASGNMDIHNKGDRTIHEKRAFALSR